MGGEKYRFACFTIYTPDWHPKCKIKFEDVNYVVCQQEMCPTTKRLHWQGYIQCKKSWGNKGIQDILGGGKCHLEKAKGNDDENTIYCTKVETAVNNGDNKSFFFGKPSKTGRRNDLSALKEDLSSGLSLTEISNKHFESFLKYNRNIREYLILNRPNRKWVTELHIEVGPSGCGKSRSAWEKYPDAYSLRKCNAGTLWWDGYDNHETVIIDDFYGWMPFDTLLRISDRYPMLVDTKGGAVNFTAKRIIITSNEIPELWYPNISNIPNRWNALLRRYTSYKNHFENHKMVLSTLRLKAEGGTGSG